MLVVLRVEQGNASNAVDRGYSEVQLLIFLLYFVSSQEVL